LIARASDRRADAGTARGAGIVVCASVAVVAGLPGERRDRAGGSAVTRTRVALVAGARDRRADAGPSTVASGGIRAGVARVACSARWVRLAVPNVVDSIAHQMLARARTQWSTSRAARPSRGGTQQHRAQDRNRNSHVHHSNLGSCPDLEAKSS
jgi:hypothetical protein